MKKALDLILPILLAFVVLLGVVSYFILFKTDLTAGFYLSRAERAVSSAHYERAVRDYLRARKLGAENAGVSISLADAYQRCGNYTKAEYTLVHAITSYPDELSLYMALSKAYVEQDKLLDAEQMLSRVANESIRAQLAELRPQAPTISPESGYYSTRIEVSAVCEGTLYLSTDGTYPSIATDRYTGPVSLNGGETAVFAIAVSDDFLVSTVARAGYTISGVIEPVTLSDPALDAAAREILGKSPEAVLMSNELWTITALTLPDLGDASELDRFSELTSLTIKKSTVTDFSVLSSLVLLQELNLSGCTVSASGLDAIGRLTELHTLRLSNSALATVSPLSSLDKLTVLDVSNNSISDISALSSLKNLTDVSFANNPISDLFALSGCTKLISLDVTGCMLSSFEPLGKMAALTSLLASGNAVSDLSALSGCAALSKLDVADNSISDISVLTSLPKLSVFFGDHNQISKIPDFPQATPLNQFSCTYNTISDIGGLSGLPYLNNVFLDYNQISRLERLTDCPNLVKVTVWGNPVSASDVKALQNMNVIVSYDPSTTN